MRVTLYYTLKRVRKILCRYCVHRLITSWTTLNTQSVCIVDDTVDFIFSIFYSKNTMDYTVYIECLHYVSHCRCLDEQGALSFPYFIPKAIAVCWIKAQPQDIKLLDLAWLPLGLAWPPDPKLLGMDAMLNQRLLCLTWPPNQFF